MSEGREESRRGNSFSLGCTEKDQNPKLEKHVWGKKKRALDEKARERGRKGRSDSAFFSVIQKITSFLGSLCLRSCSRACVVVRESSLFREQTESVF